MNEVEGSAGSTVEALLLIAPGCPHCGGMLESLGRLVKEGGLTRLKVVNIAGDPALAQTLGVRTVPWTRIEAFELAGLYSLEELRHWTRLATREDGLTLHLGELLATGQRAQVADRVRREPALLARLVALLGDPESGLSIRIGVMATLEEFETSGRLAGLTEALVPLTRDPVARIRADACHALSLTGTARALEVLQTCAQDTDPEVRETVADALEILNARLLQDG